MEFTGPFRKQIREALLDAFPTEDRLKILVQESLGVSLQRITLGDNLEELTFELINRTISSGRLTELVIAAAAEQPGNAKLRAVADQFKLAAVSTDETERIVVQGVEFENAGQWIDKAARLRHGVCRFEPQPQTESIDNYGSGFLVAPDVIMTNYHVAEVLLYSVVAAKAVVRFDFETDLAGQDQKGVEVKVASGNPLLAFSEADKLDYALVQLARRATDLPAPANQIREYLRLSMHTLVPREPVVVFQHPIAHALKLAFGTVVQPQDGDGVTYTANTEPGSSGSPIMNSALEIVAIHHRGLSSTNRGIRMGPILRHLASMGNQRFLGK